MKVNKNFICKHVLDNDILIDIKNNSKVVYKLNETSKYIFDLIVDGKTDIGNITFASNRYEQYQNYLESDEYKSKLAKVDEIKSQIDDINTQLNNK